jgi:UDP-N-acetylmuramyl pentapeptide synthase
MADGTRANGARVLLASSAEEALTPVGNAVNPSDLVLVKGSRSIGTERIVAELERLHSDVRSARP